MTNTHGNLRLVLNLHYLNQFLWMNRFKYTLYKDLQVAMLMFQKGDYLYSFDLKSGYHHVDIYEPHRKYLGLVGYNNRLHNFMYLQSYPLVWPQLRG